MLKLLLASSSRLRQPCRAAWAQGPSTPLGTSARRVALGDWPEARGANRDGARQKPVSRLHGILREPLLWRVPFGGRSAPIVMGNRVYVQNPSGRGPRCRSA